MLMEIFRTITGNMFNNNIQEINTPHYCKVIYVKTGKQCGLKMKPQEWALGDSIYVGWICPKHGKIEGWK